MLHRLVGGEAENAEDQEVAEDEIGLEEPLRRGDAVAEPGGGGDELGDDQPGPGPAEADPQRVPDARHGRGQDDPLQDAPFRHLQRAAEIDEVARHRLDIVHDQQNLLEEGADEDDEELLGVARARPQDGQRHEGHHRHVADEVDQRLDRRLPGAVAADEDADRQGERGRDQKAEADAVDADAGIGSELAAPPQLAEPADHLPRRGKEERPDQARGGDAVPERCRARRRPRSRSPTNVAAR